MANDKKLNLFEKLLGVQSELVAPKSQYNSFGKYKYRNCEDILEAVKPLLKKYELTLKISDEIVLVGDRFYTKAVVTVINPDDGTKESATGWAREELAKKGMDGSQITGSASSYARKYALNGLFCIDDTKDSDSTNKHGKDDTKNNDSKAPKSSGKSGKKCEKCNIDVSDKVAMWSTSNYNKILCMKCQKEEAKRQG